jgi:transcriptional regulator with XRE-family HTH domain
MSLSKKLKLLLTEKNLTLSDLSKESGVSIPTIHRMVKGKTKNPNEKSLEAISEYFGLSVYDLIKRDDFNEEADTNISLTKVPLIGWDNIEIFVKNNKSLYETSKKIIVANMSESAFALTMPDHSMEPMIKKDSILIFDPTFKISDRMYCLIKLAEAGVFVVREILVDVNKYFIKSLCSDSTEKPLIKLKNEDKIMAKLVEIRMQL